MYSLYQAHLPGTTTYALLARSRVAEHRPRLCLDRPDRPIFQTHPRANSRPKIGESSRSLSNSRRQVRQQRRLNFRDSIGCFETSRLVVPQPCSSPSCHQNPARRPSGQARAWTAPGSNAGRWAFSPPESLKACGPQDFCISCISETYQTAYLC